MSELAGHIARCFEIALLEYIVEHSVPDVLPTQTTIDGITWIAGKIQPELIPEVFQAVKSSPLYPTLCKYMAERFRVDFHHQLAKIEVNLP